MVPLVSRPSPPAGADHWVRIIVLQRMGWVPEARWGGRSYFLTSINLGGSGPGCLVQGHGEWAWQCRGLTEAGGLAGTISCWRKRGLGCNRHCGCWTQPDPAVRSGSQPVLPRVTTQGLPWPVSQTTGPLHGPSLLPAPPSPTRQGTSCSYPGKFETFQATILSQNSCFLKKKEKKRSSDWLCG